MTMSLLVRLRAALPSINAALFASLFFFLPGHVAPAYTLTGLILVVTLLEGGLAAKWTQLRGDPLFWIFQAFFWIVPFSLLWTEDTQSNFPEMKRTVCSQFTPQ